MLDLLSDILTRLSLRGTLYFRTSFTEPWGVRVPAFRDVARFHFAHRGEALVRVAGFADPHLARALAAFHRTPAADWTVAGMAREAGLSRTGLAERFTARLGVTPMAYVTSWRMQIAREALAGRGLTVAEAAELSGYASESAFSRAFKKEIGVSPAAVRQLRKVGGDTASAA